LADRLLSLLFDGDLFTPGVKEKSSELPGFFKVSFLRNFEGSKAGKSTFFGS
jgi:hypothetical protein